MSAQIFLGLFTVNDDLAQSLQKILSNNHYDLRVFNSSDALWESVWDQTEQIDCLILHQCEGLEEMLTRLKQDGKLLPAVILTSANENQALVYHPAQKYLFLESLSDTSSAIDDAIRDFLQLTPDRKPQAEIEHINEFLTIKQHRLTEKLQERLGYKGVYYKRKPEDFFNNLSSEEKQELLTELTEEYRLILLEYFSNATEVNSRIDQFVTRAFFANLSVSHIMEIHMNLIEQFSQHLKLEGRSDEILLDYRLTLIDIVAHLCEMYRRSLPTKVTR
ncbi:circadian clock protein KaiA [Dactylococcopsis salina]|uniref:Circadian clock oscillator protein KaiA n=1 Tax=Dactylococcopsis salina (strain PCC 8305) TaxID=13035 RepID=K9YZP8_DACS8|nr:circadian clock protein KaiA [Dactylococcopsis salina]AFZ51962.1 KaiA domain protein [Dactylococcopsis salina PCC 8305]